MPNTAVMTVRIDRNLLNEVRRVARSEGRSVSAEVVHILRRQLAPADKVVSSRAAAGMFANWDVAEDVADFRLGAWLEHSLERRIPRLPKRNKR